MIRSFWSAKEPVRNDQSSWQPMASHRELFSKTCLFLSAGWLEESRAVEEDQHWQQRRSDKHTHTHTCTVHVSDCDKHSTHPLPAFSSAWDYCVCVCVCVNATEFRHMALAVSATWDISGHSAKLPLIQTHTLKGQFIPKWTFCNLITLMSFHTCDFISCTAQKKSRCLK